MTFLFGIIYASLAVALAASIVRAVRYARLPLNLRWELYPVPHSGPGGSYFEELDWWEKAPRKNPVGEWKAMASEIFFLRAMYEHNRALWRFSYPFHLGLYMLIATAAGALIGVPRMAWVGTVGCLFVILGATGLLARRISDAKLRAYSAPADYFNLCFFIAAAGMLVFTKTGGVRLGDVARALMTFDTSVAIPAPQAVAMGLAAVLIAYIPMTHMAHFIGKYFMYHSIRWDDAPSKVAERRIAEYLTYRQTWSAPHVGTGSWAEIVTEKQK
jgi:nitrate reductase gamma subunit